MSFLKGWVDFLKSHIFSIVRVLKSMYNCEMSWEHKHNIFSFRAPCATEGQRRAEMHHTLVFRFARIPNICMRRGK